MSDTATRATDPDQQAQTSRWRAADSGWWLATFVGFPLGGLPAIALGGVDDVATALLGGGAAGLVIGTVQWLVLRRVMAMSWVWPVGTAIGLAVGLGIGSAAVDYGTGAADLLVQGAASGLGVGVAQAVALRTRVGGPFAAVWMGGAVVLWPLGWQVTRAFGVAVEDQFAVFGATGALVYTVLSGLLLAVLHRRTPPR